LISPIDMTTFIVKVDGHPMTEKIYALFRFRLSRDQSPKSSVDISGLAGYITIKTQSATCNEGEIKSGSGYKFSSTSPSENIPSYSLPLR